VNTSRHRPELVGDFDALAASDPRACLLIGFDGCIVGLNAVARRALGLTVGDKLAGASPAPDEVDAYLKLCARSRGPVPRQLEFLSNAGSPVSWLCHGGLATRRDAGTGAVVLRMQNAEAGKSIFGELSSRIDALNAELGWRVRAERDAGHLAAIVSSSTDAIFSKTLDEVVTSWNEGAERMFGFAASDIVGESALQLIPEEKRAEEQALMAQLEAGENPPPTDTVRCTRDGRLIDVSVTTSPIRDGAGDVVGVSKIVRDISARKRDEDALRAAHATFRQLVENSPFGVYAVDADFRLVQVSKGAQKVFENVRPLIGRDFADVLRVIWPEPSASEFLGRFRHTLETGEPYREPSTVAIRHDTRQVETYDWQIERIVMPDGRYGVVCHFYDLSERQRFEAALRESEKRFRGTFENVSVGIAHVGVDGEWLEVNERLCEIAGLTNDDMRRRTLESIIHPDDRALARERLAGLLAGDLASFQIEQRYCRADGTLVWVDDSVDLQRDDQGNPLYFIHVIRDITQQVAALDHQKFLMRELSHRSKNQLAVVQAIATQTARNAASVDEFRNVFARRMRGLSVSVDLLVKGGWAGVSLSELVRGQLEAFFDKNNRLTSEGPDVTVDTGAAEALGLALHELATNCVKYGAWSAGGSVTVQWDFEATGTDQADLHLSWVERGGPRVDEPERRGFGRTVIEDMVAQRLDAEVALTYAQMGVEWRLRVPGSRCASWKRG